jgi:DNA primase
MLSARSQGLPAIAVSGDHAWDASWAAVFAGRRVTVAMDCDRAGRDAAERILQDLGDAGVDAVNLELGSHRSDGFDLTDWLNHHRRLSRSTLRQLFVP